MRISENVVFWIGIGTQVLALILALLIYRYGESKCIMYQKEWK